MSQRPGGTSMVAVDEHYAVRQRRPAVAVDQPAADEGGGRRGGGCGDGEQRRREIVAFLSRKREREKPHVSLDITNQRG